MRRHLFAMGLFLAAAAATNARAMHADGVRCSRPAWKMLDMQSGRLFAHVERQCTVPLPQAVDLETFRARYIADRKANAERFHSESPIAGGTRLELTHNVRTEDGQLTIRSLTDILQPTANQFTAYMRSTNLQASGNAKYTQSVENRISLQEASSGSYTMVVSNKTVIRKPRLVPTSFMKEKVREGLEGDIERFSTEVTRQLTANR